MKSRRLILASLTSALLALTVGKVAHAEDQVIRVGTLKLIHAITPYFYQKFAPEGYKIEVIPFETPTDGKNAVVTKSVDFGSYGLAAATLGASVGEPVVVLGPSCSKGMALVAAKDGGVDTLAQLKDKRIGILPGSTQETVFLDRLKAEGMTVRDIKPVRLAFSEMATALERKDIDAYIGAEPAPSISVLRGVGKIVEYPYSTPIGTVNMVMTTHADTVKNDPDRVKLMMDIHRKASEYAMAHPEEAVAIAGEKLGISKEVGTEAIKNVELTWQATDDWVKSGQYYANLMLERKQIRRLPDFDVFYMTEYAK